MNGLIKKTGILTISNVAARLFGFVFFVILARALTISDYGLFRYLITMAGVYTILFTGIPTALTKYVGENRSNSKVRGRYIMNSLFIMLSAFFFLVLVVYLFTSNKFYLVLFMFSILIDSFYLGVVRGLLNYTKLAGFKLLENIIQLAILIISFFIYKTVSFVFAVIFFSFSGLLALVIFEVVKPQIQFRFAFSKSKIKEILKYTMPVTLGAIGWTIMFGTNAFFINQFYGSERVAYYSVGETLVQVFTFLPAAIATILLPKIAGLRDKTKIIKPLKLAIWGSFLFSFLILIPLLLFKSEIITLIFTASYLPTLIVILPLAIGQIFISIHQIYAAVFQGLGKPGIPSISISIAAALNLIGSYFLTKLYGIFGSAISISISSFIAFCVIYIWFFKLRKSLTQNTLKIETAS